MPEPDTTGQPRHPDTLTPLGYVWMPGPPAPGSGLLTVADIEARFVAVARAILVSAWPLRGLELNFLRRLLPGGPAWLAQGIGFTAHSLIADKGNTSNGQVQMTLSRLRALNASVPDAARVPTRF